MRALALFAGSSLPFVDQGIVRSALVVKGKRVDVRDTRGSPMRDMNLRGVRTRHRRDSGSAHRERTRRWLLALLLAFFAATPSGASTETAAMHPIERQMRDRFPSVALHSEAEVEPAQ